VKTAILFVSGVCMGFVLWLLLASFGWVVWLGFACGATGAGVIMWTLLERARLRTVTLPFPMFTDADLGCTTIVHGELCRVVAVPSATTIVVRRVDR
jgi:hypothetical protein